MKITLVNAKDVNDNSLVIDTQALKDPKTTETIDFNLPRFSLSGSNNKKYYVSSDNGSFYTGVSNEVNYYHNDQEAVSSVTGITNSSQLPKNTYINSEVNSQDNDSDLGTQLLNTALNSVGNLVGVTANSINNIKNLFSTDTENIKTNNLLLDQWKSEHYKKFHTTDWTSVQTLNPTENAANTAMSDLRGELGKTTGGLTSLVAPKNSWAKAGLQLADTLLGTSLVNSVANTAGTFTQNEIGDSAWQADADELAALNTVTKDTMYTGKPGIRFKAKADMVQNIATNDASASIFGATRYSNKKDIKETTYGSDFEQLRSNQIGASRLSKIRTMILNQDNTFTKKKMSYNLKEAKTLYGSLYNLNETTGGGYAWQRDSDYGLSDEEAQLITLLKNKNTYNKTLGYLYIRPFYDYEINSALLEEKTNNGFGVFDIPFEFNPNISESAMQANYQQETLLGRLGQFHIYTGTNLSTITMELTYYALTPDTLSAEDQNNIGRQYGTDAWQYYWNNSMIEAIELKLRSLVLADYVSDNNYLIKPPLVEIHLENSQGENYDTVGDLYKYPGSVSWNETTNIANITNTVGSNYLAKSGTSRYKKYIVNSVQIDKISEADILYPSLYGRQYNNNYNTAIQQNPRFHLTTSEKGNKGYSGYSRKKGFKASLQLTEVTENFLDLVPDFKAYYDAWSYKQIYGNTVSSYAEVSLGIDSSKYQSVEDVLTVSAATLSSSLASKDEQIDALFDEAEQLAGLYAKSLTEVDSKPKFNIGLFNKAADSTETAKQLKNNKNKYYFMAGQNQNKN